MARRPTGDGEGPGGSFPASVRMHGTAQDGSVFNQVAGDQYNIELPQPPPAPVACTLPADTPAFTGRASELDGIVAAALAAGI